MVCLWSGEMLDWVEVLKCLLDVDLIVLCWYVCDNEFWMGYWDGEGWIGCESGGLVLGVMYWVILGGL